MESRGEHGHVSLVLCLKDKLLALISNSAQQLTMHSEKKIGKKSNTDYRNTKSEKIGLAIPKSHLTINENKMKQQN